MPDFDFIKKTILKYFLKVYLATYFVSENIFHKTFIFNIFYFK